MNRLIQLTLFLLVVMLPVTAKAYDFEVNGIYYNKSGTNATVTYQSYSNGTSTSDYTGSVTIPKTVTYNGTTYSVTSIGNHAFDDCSGLTSVTIPNSVTSIGDYAFRGCSGLTSVTIPNSVTTIGNAAFSGCRSLKTLNFNAILCDDFNYYVDDGKKGDIFGWSYPPFFELDITTINIGDSVQRIPAYLAFGLTNLTSINIPNSVTSIGHDAFNCRGLIAVNISDLRAWCNISFETYSANPLYFAHHLYLDGSEVADLIIPNSVTSIGDYAFRDCSGLTSVTIPNSVTSIGGSAFYGCSGLTSATIGNSVKTIGYSAFSGCSGLTSVTIGNSVKTIGYYAFSGCSGLTSVTLPNSVTEIGNYAFLDCSNINNVTMSNTLASIGFQAFGRCNGLTSVTIPNSVTKIGNYAFYQCNGLTNLTIGYSVTSIGDYAFGNCSSLAKVTISDLSAWCNIIFGNSDANPLRYAQHLFLNGNEIIDLSIPNAVTTINSYTFYGCKGLKTLTIPNSVTSIGNYAFQGCSSLETLNFNATSCADFSSASSSPFYGLNFSTINIGNSVQRIPADFANGMTNLTSITIPNSVTIIGGYAFYGCSGLSGTMTIPKNVTYIGTRAFYNVPSIEAVTCAAKTPPAWDYIAMFTTNVYNHSPLYVPLGSERAYMSDQSWGQFVTIIGKEIQDEVLATGISLNQSQMNLQVGSTSQLIATVLPDSTTNKVVTWFSRDPEIATVDTTGFVTAIAPGSATITATTTDGSNLSASCDVTVTEDLSNYDNYLSMSDTAAFRGDTIVIPIKMTNESSIISFQTDIFLPEGLELLQEDGEYIIDPSERMTRTHSIMSNDVSNGAIRVLCYSSNYKPFTGNSGDDLFYITVKVVDNAEGNYTIQLKNTLLTNTDFVDLAAPDVVANVNVKAYLLGDANNSGTVSITDVVVTAQYVLELNPQPFVFEAADANADGNITVADVSRIAWMVLNPTLNAPLRAPALWNNGDRMSAEDITLASGETRRVSILLDNDMDYAAFQLDLELPSGLTASNFQLTDRASGHAFDVNTLRGGKIRALCYTPALTAISGHEGALLTFDVTATGTVKGDIAVDGIELVTPTCQTVNLDGFAIGVNNSSAVNELKAGKSIARVDYFNVAGQQIDRPDSGVTLVVTTYTDGTRTTTKVIQ